MKNYTSGKWIERGVYKVIDPNERTRIPIGINRHQPWLQDTVFMSVQSVGVVFDMHHYSSFKFSKEEWMHWCPCGSRWDHFDFVNHHSASCSGWLWRSNQSPGQTSDNLGPISDHIVGKSTTTKSRRSEWQKEEGQVTTNKAWCEFNEDISRMLANTLKGTSSKRKLEVWVTSLDDFAKE